MRAAGRAKPTRLICKIPPHLPLPASSRKKTPKGGITPLWQRGASLPAGMQGEIERDYKIAFSFPNLKAGLTAKIKIPPTTQKIAAK